MSEGGFARAVLAAATALVCSSCLVGPDYKPPAMGVSAQWNAPLERGLTTGPAPAPGQPDIGRLWWKSLGDPQLDDLIARAIAGNTDVKVAVARIHAARAARKRTVAAFFPVLDSTVAYDRRRSSGAVTTTSREFNSYAAGFDSSWEIDLFGGLRRGTEQAGAELEAAEGDLGAVLVSILAEVALNYVEMRSLQARISIAESNAESQRETLDLARWRFQAGLAGFLDVEQADYNLAQTRSRIPALEIELAAARNRIAVLLGLRAGSLDAGFATRRPVPAPPPRVVVGLAADLLRRRPDVAAAERRLAAATAAVGVATAELYPKLTLSGTFSIAATDVADLDSAAARAWSVGPALRWNLFDVGRIRGLIEQRSAESDAALAAWEAAVLAAGEEAENALVAYAREQERRDRLTEAHDAARRAQELARLQYENGLVDFQQVLEAQRATFGFEESLAVSEAAVITHLVALYKALGGGWETVACDDDGCDGEVPAALTSGAAPPSSPEPLRLQEPAPTQER
jgi:multidrug efflux system outer membrane protein